MANWAITTAGALFNIEATQGTDFAVPIAIDSTHFMLTNAGTLDDGFAQIMVVNTGTWAITTTGTSLEFDTQQALYNNLLQVDSTHFLNIWQDVSADGVAQVLVVNTSTWAITTAASLLEFETQQFTTPMACQVDTNHFFVMWADSATDGIAQILAVNTTTWAVTTAANIFEFDTRFGLHGSCVKIDDTHVFAAWKGGATPSGLAQIMAINTTTWAITTAAASLNFDTQELAYSRVVLIDSNHVLLVYQGTAASSATAQVFAINTTTWAVTTASAHFAISTLVGAYPSVVIIDTNHVAVLYRDLDADGYTVILEINTTTWAVTTAAAALEYDTQGVSYNISVRIDTNHFMALWQGQGTTDGYAQIFSVAIPSAIKTVNGLAKASVKTWNGLAIASVKTINGLA